MRPGLLVCSSCCTLRGRSTETSSFVYRACVKNPRSLSENSAKAMPRRTSRNVSNCFPTYGEKDLDLEKDRYWSKSQDNGECQQAEGGEKDEGTTYPKVCFKPRTYFSSHWLLVCSTRSDGTPAHSTSILVTPYSSTWLKLIVRVL